LEDRGTTDAAAVTGDVEVVDARPIEGQVVATLAPDARPVEIDVADESRKDEGQVAGRLDIAVKVCGSAVDSNEGARRLGKVRRAGEAKCVCPDIGTNIGLLRADVEIPERGGQDRRQRDHAARSDVESAAGTHCRWAEVQVAIVNNGHSRCGRIDG